jgi:hypothetical protein
LAKKNAPNETKNINTISEDIILGREKPADFIETNSWFSARLPKVIMEAKSIAKGKAMGTSVTVARPMSLKITYQDKPLPTRSSIYFHKNCINRVKSAITSVKAKGPTNDFNI